MRIIQKNALLALMLCAAVVSAQPAPAPLKLSSGTYKFFGECTRLSVLTNEFPYQCANYMGIVADDPSLPNFVFFVEGKTWLYRVSGPALFSQDGALATYPVAEMFDMVVERKYVYPGQCVMSARIGEPLVRCTMWRDLSHNEITREIEFSGNGTWMFSRKDAP